ncbi:MAG: phosphatase PAP2 family protein [Hamadaea sp.]|uniref:phosphatase PAP2 family protein n=1 Tax=Hamadaea sp. TaxID=2024425 RepID=UPI001830CCC8|nr:phosphatase PAP2 family protein [Hamadaea sp.]NUT21797.1 phosphatase PAP2 family protein [Hamadaea sp.]
MTRWLTAEILVLVAGIFAVLALAALFVEVLDAVGDADDLTVIDRPTVDWLAAHRAPALTTVQIAITTLGDAKVLVPLVALAAIVVAWQLRSWEPVVLALVGLGGIHLLTSLIKVLVARPRPNPPNQAVPVTGFSFPSGHTTGSLVGFCLLAWLISMLTRNVAVRWAVWSAAVVFAVLVGLSRVYLGVHYPSDVIGGWLLALAWLGAVAIGANRWNRRVEARLWRSLEPPAR